MGFMIFCACLSAAVLFAAACGGFYWLRQTVRERFTKTTAELHTIEAILAEHRNLLEHQGTCQNEMKKSLDELSKAVLQPVETGLDPDSRLSRAMEEGVMNLMQYAAGKISSRVEVGLG